MATRWLTATLLAAAMPAAAQKQPTLHRDMKPIPIGGIIQWFGPDNYPPEAIRQARQGRVVAAVGVDSAGQVVSCGIDESSGTTSLDLATCAIATAHLQFNPATDHQGRPIASVYRLPVRWVLPEGNPEAPANDLAAGPHDDRLEVAVTLDANGVVTACKVLANTTPRPAADPCTKLTPGTRPPGVRRWLRDGRPVGVTVIQRYSEQVTATP